MAKLLSKIDMTVAKEKSVNAKPNGNAKKPNATNKSGDSFADVDQPVKPKPAVKKVKSEDDLPGNVLPLVQSEVLIIDIVREHAYDIVERHARGESLSTIGASLKPRALTAMQIRKALAYDAELGVLWAAVASFRAHFFMDEAAR